jgi:hypothetical protein
MRLRRGIDVASAGNGHLIQDEPAGPGCLPNINRRGG